MFGEESCSETACLVDSYCPVERKHPNWKNAPLATNSRTTEGEKRVGKGKITSMSNESADWNRTDDQETAESPSKEEEFKNLRTPSSPVKPMARDGSHPEEQAEKIDFAPKSRKSTHRGSWLISVTIQRVLTLALVDTRASRTMIGRPLHETIQASQPIPMKHDEILRVEAVGSTHAWNCYFAAGDRKRDVWVQSYHQVIMESISKLHNQLKLFQLIWLWTITE